MIGQMNVLVCEKHPKLLEADFRRVNDANSIQCGESSSTVGTVVIHLKRAVSNLQLQYHVQYFFPLTA